MTSDPPLRRQAFSLKPLMFETCVCTFSMISFVALVGPIARVLGLQPWQAGATMTAGGLAWVLFARVWGAASDRRGRRRVILQRIGGFALSRAAMCAFIIAALRESPAPWVSVAGPGIAGLLAARGLGLSLYFSALLPVLAFVVWWR